MTVEIPQKVSLQSPHFYKQSICEKVREVILLIMKTSYKKNFSNPISVS